MKPTEADLKRAREFWHTGAPSIASIAQLIAEVRADEARAAGERCAVAYAKLRHPRSYDHILDAAKTNAIATDNSPVGIVRAILAAAKVQP